MKATAKTILITGCSSGFGKAMVGAFLAEGWSVIACLRRAGERRELFAAELERHPESLHLCDLEYASVSDRQRLVRMIAEEYRGRLDGAILNAGFALFGAVEDVSEEELRRRSVMQCDLVERLRAQEEQLAQVEQCKYGSLYSLFTVLTLHCFSFILNENRMSRDSFCFHSRCIFLYYTPWFSLLFVF